ncbi:hypothetical protein IAT40_002677 [Kwoniella sp. CBS 6097]
MPVRSNKRPSTSESTQNARNRRRSSDNDALLPMTTQQPLTCPPPGAIPSGASAPAHVAVGSRQSSRASATGPLDRHYQQSHLHQPQPLRAQPVHGEAHPALERREFPGQPQRLQTRPQGSSQRSARVNSSSERRPFGQKSMPDPNVDRLSVSSYSHGGRMPSPKGSIDEPLLKPLPNAKEDNANFFTRAPLAHPNTSHTQTVNADYNAQRHIESIERVRMSSSHAEGRSDSGRQSPFRRPSSIARYPIPQPLDQQPRRDVQSRTDHRHGQMDMMAPLSSTSSTFSASNLVTPTTSDMVDVCWPQNSAPVRSIDQKQSSSSQQEALPHFSAPPSAPAPSYTARFDDAPAFEFDDSEFGSPDSTHWSRLAPLNPEVPRRNPVGLGLNMDQRQTPCPSEGAQQSQGSRSCDSHSLGQDQRSRMSIHNLVNATTPPASAEDVVDTGPGVLTVSQRLKNLGLGLFGTRG